MLRSITEAREWGDFEDRFEGGVGGKGSVNIMCSPSVRPKGFLSRGWHRWEKEGVQKEGRSDKWSKCRGTENGSGIQGLEFIFVIQDYVACVCQGLLRFPSGFG